MDVKCTLNLNDILNLAALIFIPIVAVWIGQYLQARAKKRDDKMRVFETLMASRIFGLSNEAVRAYNMIHITFADEKVIREKWESYYRALCIEQPNEAQAADIEKKQIDLLKAIASSLGYKDELSQAALDTKYIPTGLIKAAERDMKQRQDYETLLDETVSRLRNNQPLPPL